MVSKVEGRTWPRITTYLPPQGAETLQANRDNRQTESIRETLQQVDGQTLRKGNILRGRQADVEADRQADREGDRAKRVSRGI